MANHEHGRNVHFHFGAEDHRSGTMFAHNIDQMSWLINEAVGVENKRQEDEKEESSSCRKKSNPIRLEKLIYLQDESSAYSYEDKDDAAFGLLRKQYQLGAEASFIPVLIDYYLTLIKTERGDECEEVFYQLVDLMKTKLNPTVKECKRLGDKYRNNKEYFKSILFYQIGGTLLADVKDADRFLSCVQGCALGTKLCVMKMVQEMPEHKENVKLYIIPMLRKMVCLISDMKGKSRKALCLIESVCKHHVEICEGLVGDYEASTITLTETVALLENTLGDEAKKFHLYGTALNNLGATLLRQHKPDEAIAMLARAIDANMNAQDYNSEDERQKDVARSGSAITQAEELLESMRE